MISYDVTLNGNLTYPSTKNKDFVRFRPTFYYDCQSCKVNKTKNQRHS